MPAFRAVADCTHKRASAQSESDLRHMFANGGEKAVCRLEKIISGL